MSAVASDLVVGLFGVLAIVLAALVLLEGLVLIEMVKQVAQLRERADLDDQPEPVTLGSRAGKLFPRLELLDDPDRDAVFLFLSVDCLSCKAVATAVKVLRARAERQFQLISVIEGRSEEDMAAFVDETGLSDQRVVFDGDRDIGLHVGIAGRPAALVVRSRRMAEALAVRTASQLDHLVERLLQQGATEASLPRHEGEQREHVSVVS